MRDIQEFDNLKIRLASPEQIRNWSYGEVKKPETINYRNLRPEKDGLFCERIFGTTKEWECFCGKFKSIRYKGVVCDRCGVEITHSRVRRERMGHVELAAPVSHIWYYRSIPSSMGALLSLSQSALRAVLYYEKYIVVDPGNTELETYQLLNEEEYSEARDRFGEAFNAGIGAECIKQMLENLDLDALSGELRAKMIEKGSKADKKLLKRIEIVENFNRSDNHAKWMIMDVIPVIPPDLRPMVQLDGGRFATSDLNDLYRRVINRNNRLKRLLSLSAPEVIIRNEKCMLQESVDALLDNSKRKKVNKGPANRPLKSLSDLLKGKQGRFRQNLLGKRVDYSGRSVIVVGPQLKLHQCGLPTKMALELYKPFIMRRLVEKEVVFNIKKAKTLVEQTSMEVWEVLDEVVREHPVLLNRAPTLHRLGIQAFEPVLVEGKAIQLHPLVCNAFNADFDGDQMAVHLPLTQAAQVECWSLMLASKNLMNPANGMSIVFPSQDMVLGIYLLTKSRQGERGEGRYFCSFHEVIKALELGQLSYHSLVKVPNPEFTKESGELESRWIETTPGRIVFNQGIPNGMVSLKSVAAKSHFWEPIPFVNETLDDRGLRCLIERSFEQNGASLTVELLDYIKETGFRYATLLGCSIGIDDMLIPEEKRGLIEHSNEAVARIQNQYRSGHITNEERYNRVVEVWSKTNEDLTRSMMDLLSEDQQGFNNVYIMADSGARGSRNQIRQLAGMRGLMAKPSGDIIELPIRSNFKEGLSVIEFFISTNGARKGLADTALKTADAGYLTRRLVDISQDVVVNQEDCGTINGIVMSALKDGEEIVESLSDRVRGSYTLERVKHPITGELILNVNEEITDGLADEIEQIGIEEVRVRTVLTCEARYGVCCKCYGRDLSTRKTVNVGEAVGILAAQSIGQPGTQLTMRTFHVGGTASTIAEENRIVLKYPVLVRRVEGHYLEMENQRLLFTRKGYIFVAKILERHELVEGDEFLLKDGERVVKGVPIIQRMQSNEVIEAQQTAFLVKWDDLLLLVAQDQRLEVRNGANVNVCVGQLVEIDEPIAVFDPFSDPIIAEQAGTVHFVDLINGVTLREELNEETGNIEKKIAEQFSQSLEPRIEVLDDEEQIIGNYYLPGGSYLSVEDGAHIAAGRVLAKLLKESAKTQDITGGLPRVVELFEARRPKNATILASITGTVHFRGLFKGKRLVIVEDEYGNESRHLIPQGRHLLIRDGDPVVVAEPLCDGPIDPHSVLEIQGENALQRFLVDEVQEVYRMQGVNINDKHIGVIIRQMMRKVEVMDVGDTQFIYGQQVDKYTFRTENDNVICEGGRPAVARPLLQGITKASLNINSWVSAASFQETTRVLTNAAIAGNVDPLNGLKENVIIGHMIPAGTGMRKYRELQLYTQEMEDLDTHVQQILEQRRIEAEEAERLALEEEAKEDMLLEDDPFPIFDEESASVEAVVLPEDETGNDENERSPE